MTNAKVLTRSVLNAVGVYGYVWLVALIMQNRDRLFGKTDTIVTGVVVLMLFVLSASITILLLLGRPIQLYLDNKKSESVSMLLDSVATLAVLTVATMIILAVFQ